MPLTRLSAETIVTLEPVVTKSFEFKFFATNCYRFRFWMIINNFTCFLLLSVRTMLCVQSHHRCFKDGIIVSPLVEVVPDTECQSTRTRCRYYIFSECWHWHQILCAKFIFSISVILKNKLSPILHSLMLWSRSNDSWWNTRPIHSFKSHIRIHNPMQELEWLFKIKISAQIYTSKLIQDHWFQNI